MDLSAGQRERIRELLEEELRAAYRRAVDGGLPPKAVEADVADRRRALEALARGFVAHDPEHPLHETGQGGGVGQEG
jgi:hypothetical protein